MAANPKTLRIVRSRDIRPGSRAIEIECIEGGPFEDIGGRYVILHTGAIVDERPIKRAYSLMPVEGEPSRAEIVVKRLGRGPGSNALADAAMGTTLSFSGPWGKLVPETGLGERTLIVATDTGITSALGIVASVETKKQTPTAEVIWFRTADEDFLDVNTVRSRVERAKVRFTHVVVPAVAAEGRVEMAHAYIGARVSELLPTLVIATGDGAIVHPLKTRLSPIEVRIECYFRNPEKKIGA